MTMTDIDRSVFARARAASGWWTGRRRGRSPRRPLGLSGMDAMCAIRDGILPPPPMARLIGFGMRVAEPGRIVMELEPR